MFEPAVLQLEAESLSPQSYSWRQKVWDRSLTAGDRRFEPTVLQLETEGLSPASSLTAGGRRFKPAVLSLKAW